MLASPLRRNSGFKTVNAAQVDRRSVHFCSTKPVNDAPDGHPADYTSKITGKAASALLSLCNETGIGDMAKPSKAKSVRRSRPLYFSAKISEYQFKKVLWHFVLDHSAQEAARHVELSVNSISAIFTKLRKSFFEVGLFTDIYGGRDPREGSIYEDGEAFEKWVIEFHFKRAAAKRGITDWLGQPAYHFAESHWRFHYTVMTEGRAADAIYDMMHAHLLEIIRCCGPVGAPPVRRKAGLMLALKHMDQRVLWLARNAINSRRSWSKVHLFKLLDDR